MKRRTLLAASVTWSALVLGLLSACVAEEGSAEDRVASEIGEACSDTPPSGSPYTCAQQAAWGKCSESWMANACNQSCGRCSAGTGGAGTGGAGGGSSCTDVAPDGNFTCAQQAAWGKCSQSWMANYCNASCGRCAPSGTGGSGSGGGGAAGTGGAGGSLSTVDADDARFRYAGRVDFSEPKRPKFSAAAVHVTARLRGRPTAVLLEDELKYGTTRGYYDVFVDGAPVLRVRPERNVTRYALPNITAGEHTLVVVKRTEALVGSGRFLGLELEGELLNPPAAPARKLEFIGDSITAGSGNEAANGSSQCNEDGWGQPYENGYLAYGPVVARSLGADYHVTAVSGIGLVRNYSSRYDARTMADVYDLTFTEDSASPRWDASRYVPDAVVVALGTNDWSPGDTPRPTMKVDDFAAAYVRFIRKLRGYYPNASFFAVSSPMLGDGYPNPTDTAASDQRAAISKAVSELNLSGDRKVYKFFVTKQNGEGCGTHPSAAQQADTARELGDYMRTTLGW